MKKIGLHWWILGGIALGTLFGALLHGTQASRIRKDLAVEHELVGRGVKAAELASAGAALKPEEYEDLLVRAAGAIRARTGTPRTVEEISDRLTDDDLAALYGGGKDRARQLVRKRLEQLDAYTLLHSVGKLFLSLLKMIVLPLVLSSLVAGVASLGGRLGRIGLKTLAYYLTTSLLAILTGLLLVNLIQPGIASDGKPLGLPIPEGQVVHKAPESAWNILFNMIPTNVFKAAADFDLFQVIFFAILLGIFLTRTEEKYSKPVVGFFEGMFEVMMKMTHAIVRLAPIGIIGLVGGVVAISGVEVFLDLIGYVVAVFSGLCIHFFLTLPLIFYLLTRRNPYLFMKAMSSALLTGFSTASSAGTLPVTIEAAERNAGISNRITSFVLPLGATVNMDGTALYECVAVIFIAQALGVELTFSSQLTIVLLALMVSIGAAGIPHAGLVMMIIIFDAVGIPAAAAGIIWSVDRVLDMCRTATNIWSDACGTAVIAHAEGEIDESVLFGRDR